MNKLMVFAFVAAVSCNDLIQGPEGGRKIYDETKEASPAIWKQKSEVTIQVNDTDVISRIVINDLRPEKDGEVKIIEGGQGHKNVTFELKSPTILRGYDFHIEIYAAEDNGQPIEYPEEQLHPEELPVMENDTQVNHHDTKNINEPMPLDVFTSPVAKEVTKANTETTPSGKTVSQESMLPHSLLLPTQHQQDISKPGLNNDDKSKGTPMLKTSSVMDDNILHPHLLKDGNSDGQEKLNSHVAETIKPVVENHMTTPKVIQDMSEELEQREMAGIKRL